MCWLQVTYYRGCGHTSPIRPAGYVVDPKTAWIPATAEQDAVMDDTMHKDTRIIACRDFMLTKQIKDCSELRSLETMEIVRVGSERMCDECTLKSMCEQCGLKKKDI
jgi:hypothetical protein